MWFAGSRCGSNEKNTPKEAAKLAIKGSHITVGIAVRKSEQGVLHNWCSMLSIQNMNSILCKNTKHAIRR
jgi:hypothetical protein